jgi:hypothetical protein
MTDDERSRLLLERARIVAEIRAYPPPIPACDAQFNWLLERRAEIERALVYGAQTSAGT